MMNLTKSILLPNGLTMEVWDASRAIASDTVKVDLIIRIRVEVRREYLKNAEQFEATRKAFGPEVLFEYRKERTFVEKDSKEAVFSELLDEFKENSLDYISRPDFPSKLVISKYLETQKHPYKFQRH